MQANSAMTDADRSASAVAKIAKIETLRIGWAPGDAAGRRSALVRVTTIDGIEGYGEASPMLGGEHSLGIVDRDIAPDLVGASPFDTAVLHDRMLHKLVKLGPEGAATGALAAVDIALWDLKGKILGLPVHALLGGAWRRQVPFYSSIGGNARRSANAMLHEVEARLATEQPAAIKIRWDGDRTRQDEDIPGDIAKARAVRDLVGPDLPLAFDANNLYSVAGAIRVGRALEDLGYAWFEEPVQHYDIHGMGEVARKLDITVSAGEQSYTLNAVLDLIRAGVRMVQPDIIKMGGITGLMRCFALAQAHGVEIVPHQTQPVIGHLANLHVVATQMHMTRPAEYADPSGRMDKGFLNPPRPINGIFELGDDPGLGITVDAQALEERRIG